MKRVFGLIMMAAPFLFAVTVGDAAAQWFIVAAVFAYFQTAVRITFP